MKVKWFFVMIFLLFLVIFTTQNYETIEIKFLKWNYATSKALLVFLSFMIGIIFGWLTPLLNMPLFRKKEEIKEEKK